MAIRGGLGAVSRPSPPGITRPAAPGIRPAPPALSSFHPAAPVLGIGGMGEYGRGFNWERATLNPYGYRRGRCGTTPYYGGWQGHTEIVVQDIYDDGGDEGDGSDIGHDPSDPGAGNPGLPSVLSLQHSMPLSIDTRADEPSLGTELVPGTCSSVGYERGYTRHRKHISAFPIASTTNVSIGHEARVNFGEDWSRHHRRYHRRHGSMGSYGQSAMNTQSMPFVRPEDSIPAPPSFGWDYDHHGRRQYYEHTPMGQYSGDHGRGYIPEIPGPSYRPDPPFIGPGWHHRGYIPPIPTTPRRLDYPYVPIAPPNIAPTGRPTLPSLFQTAEANFGWMMPTLPGAISESPLVGVFAPTGGLTGTLGRGGLG
jgi:hypothetical protein